MAKTSNGSKRKPWRKVLYENREYPDNYTDASFLKEMRTNLYVHHYNYREAILGTTILTNHISCITAFLIVYHMLLVEIVTPTKMLSISSIIIGIGYFWFRGRHQFTLTFLLEDSKTLVTVILFGYIFSPLLHTLTVSISTDTIYTMTFFVLFLNVIFFDYGLNVAMVSRPISVNAGIFGAICLASRLSTSYHAFVLLVESAVFFVLYPILTAKSWHPFCMIPIFIACCLILLHLSTAALVIYVTLIILVNFFFTGIFVMLQRFKFNIHGPWDEAMIEENDDENLDENL